MSNITELPALIDSYVAKREGRLALERNAEELKKQEESLKKQIEKTLRDNNLVTGGGGSYRATLVDKIKPTVEDWGLVYQFITETNSFDLLQKRLTESAVKARWEDGVKIPGVVKFPVTELSITKV